METPATYLVGNVIYGVMSPPELRTGGDPPAYGDASSAVSPSAEVVDLKARRAPNETMR